MRIAAAGTALAMLAVILVFPRFVLGVVLVAALLVLASAGGRRGLVWRRRGGPTPSVELSQDEGDDYDRGQDADEDEERRAAER